MTQHIFPLARRYRSFLAVISFVVTLSVYIGVPARCDLSAGNAATDFKLTGVDRSQHALSDYKGKPVVLFFFCGCKWCHDAARAWALSERKSGDGQPATALVVFSGEADEAAQFGRQTGLDRRNTTILVDDSMAVTMGLYHAAPCPRVFVLSGTQQVEYTNNHADDAPRTITGAQLISRVRRALAAMPEQSSPPVQTADLPPPFIDTEAPVYLTPLAGDGVSVEGTGLNREGHYDFGTASQAQTKTIQHVFMFRNDTDKDVLIDRIQPSCGCTNAFINDTADFPVVVKQGDSIRVTAYVDLTDLYPAAVEKSVMIFRTGQIEPVAFVEITGNLIP